MSGSVERAVRRDLRRLDKTARDSTLAAAALTLAQLLDDPATDDIDKRLQAAAQATRELRSTMIELLKDVPKQKRSSIDELRARRAAREASG